MSLVSVNDVLKITTRVEKIHPYKVYGDTDSYGSYCEGWSDCVSLIEHYLENLPSAEPERKKGKWMPDKSGVVYWICSECGFASEAFGANILYHFCPHCGAEMTRGENGKA